MRNVINKGLTEDGYPRRWPGQAFDGGWNKVKALFSCLGTSDRGRKKI